MRRHVALFLPACLLIAGCGTEERASYARGADSTSATEPIGVTLTDAGCEPTSIDVTAGPIVFDVDNATTEKSEFEIISDKPEILLEEFVEAGATAEVNTTLLAGEFEIICGAPSNTRAVLRVTGGGSAAPSTSVVDPAELARVAAEYQAFVVGQVDDLATGTRQFTDAVRAGDTEAARGLYAAARIPWETIEPIAELFPDLDGLIDGRSDDYAGAEGDPDFTGFHALEYGLWAQGTVDGAAVDLIALADRLDADIATLATGVRTLTIEPQIMTNGAAALIEEAAQTKTSGEEERYSRTDLVTFEANVAGSKRVFDLVTPLLSRVDADLVGAIGEAFATVESALDQYRSGDSFVGYDEVTERDRALFTTSMAALSEELAKVTGSLGLVVTG